MAEYIVSAKAITDAVCDHFDCHVPLRLVRFKKDLNLVELVRCKDCKKRLPKGWRFDEYCNGAEQDACNLFSNHDFDWNYTSFFYVEPDDFCKWGEAE